MKYSFCVFMLALACVPLNASAQMTRLEGDNLLTQADILADDNGVEYSTLINIRFNQPVMLVSSGQAEVARTSVNELFPATKTALDRLEKKYGSFRLVKTFPWAEWGETEKTLPGSSRVIRLPELSQQFEIHFEKAIPIVEATSFIERFAHVELVYGPERAFLLAEPNDWSYQEFLSTGDPGQGQWGLTMVDAETAWDYTTGSSALVIGITEPWDTEAACEWTTPHVDLLGKLDNASVNNCFSTAGPNSWHGTATAGVAGALTNNGGPIAPWAASLGWNTSLQGFGWGAAGIYNAINAGVDVINASWRTVYGEALDQAVWTALNNDIIVVAGNGNGRNPDQGFFPPVVTYPSAFDYRTSRTLLSGTVLTSLGDTQVFAVAASTSEDEYLDSCPGGVPDLCPYNYSPGTDPINDPVNAFMDMAAPGINVWILYTTAAVQSNMVRRSGTSFSAPMVSALAALLLSMEATLSPADVYELITQSADKAGQNSYDANGWNQYFGYGRVNAGRATCYLDGACVPGAPSSLTMINAGSVGSHPNLEWDRSSGPVQEYHIYRAAIIGGGGYSKIGETTSLSFVDTEITIGTSLQYDDKYGYQVVGIGYGSDSAFSNVANTWGEVSFKNGEVALSSIPEGYSLGSSYPNPFNPTTVITFTLPVQDRVRLELSDLTGRVVRVLFDGLVHSGEHSVRLDAGSLPSGVYLYTLKTSEFSASKTAALIR